MSYYDAAYSTRNTIENTKAYTRRVLDRNVPGAIVECGVAAGAQLGAVQDVLREKGKTRWVYGFDSFKGIPLASAKDDVQPGIGPKADISYKTESELLVSSGITVHDKQTVWNNLTRWSSGNAENVVLVEGWFQNTVHHYRTVFQQLGGIALLRLDGDLYESTRVCLEALVPYVNDGGIIIIDDWALTGCRNACIEYFAHHSVCQIVPPHGTALDGPAYFVKRSVPALAYRRNIYSQNGEDGILAELLRRLPETSGWVCEFGAWDGKQCANTFALVEQGLNAVYIEARDDYFQDLLKTCRDYPNIHPVHKLVAYEGEDTLDDILATTPIPKEFDILSIDIDSFDYQVWRSVDVYSPKIVIVEINSSISPLDTTHIHGPGKEGTGFAPMLALGESKGYTLICHTGNLIFVRNDLANLYEHLLIPGCECHRTNWIFG
jgi:hypothetical protein